MPQFVWSPFAVRHKLRSQQAKNLNQQAPGKWKTENCRGKERVKHKSASQNANEVGF